jgi:hypothetical protein
MILVGFVIECGEPGACVTPVEVTVNTYSLLAVSLIAYRWFALSQNNCEIRFVVNRPVNFVIGFAPLKWKICNPPPPPTARNLPFGDIQ